MDAYRKLLRGVKGSWRESIVGRNGKFRLQEGEVSPVSVAKQ